MTTVYVLDTCAWLNDSIRLDLVEKEVGKSLFASIVVPTAVIREIAGLQNAHDSHLGERAASVNKLFLRLKKMGGAAFNYTLPAGNMVLQSEKQTYYPLERVGRNQDSKIVACAIYFCGVSDNDHSSGDEAKRCILVTDDRIMQIKALTYEVPIMDVNEFNRVLKNGALSEVPTIQ